MRKHILIFLTIILISFQSHSQACFEINRILVDACGPVEGENEMLTFSVGGSPLNTAFLTVQWPNNSWLGLCQDGGTASTIAFFNSNIQGCGHLIEPVNGILPANSKVILITSQSVSLTSNSFANLNDTVYVLFQCSGNTSGHFANYNVSQGLRTTILTFSAPSGCSDTVTYDRAKLINQFGYFGGANYENDGAFVDFAPDGTATYLNYGCQAPVTNFNVNAGKDTTFCYGSVIELHGHTAGATGLQWSGGTGTIINSASAVTSYIPGPGETGNILFTLSADGDCSISDTDSVLIFLADLIPTPVIQNNNPLLISSINNPLYLYQWTVDGIMLLGANNPQFTITLPGCYGLTLSDTMGCSVESDTVCISTVGIEEVAQSWSLFITGSPGTNPELNISKDYIKIKIEIYDVRGRRVNSREYLHDRTIRLNTGLQCGLYSIHVTGADLNRKLRFAIIE
ncbi:MAG: hypothetical protein LC117_01375 [Bacteroidia bacterium]|nr:hypothetical protein [Bacteroidia bacterium]MCZ2276569.1 hypothetical protein [Bacteroidia bacterium]